MNTDSMVHGIVIQLPLPRKFDDHFYEIINTIDEKKDVDCLNIKNYSNMLFFNEKRDKNIFLTDEFRLNSRKLKQKNKKQLVAIKSKDNVIFPCCTLAINALCHQYDIEIKNKNVLIIGNSYLVGYTSFFFFQKKYAKVTIADKYTDNIKELALKADIIVSATGQKDLITGDMVKEGAIIFDVGVAMNEENKIVGGDVHFDSCIDKASLITPVPGGIGPLTISYMLYNVWNSFKISHQVVIESESE